jgi:hypothetical protein
MSREAQLGVWAAVEAAGLDAPSRLGLDPERFGAFAAAGYEVTDIEDVIEMLAASRSEGASDRLDLSRLFRDGVHRMNPLAPLKTLPNMALFHAALTLGLRGPHASLGSSPAAGLAALDAAREALSQGEADAALVLGTDAQVEHFRVHYMAESGALPASVPGEAGAALIVRRDGGPVIRSIGLGQEPTAGTEPREHYLRIADFGERRAALYRETLDAAFDAGAPPVDLVLADLRGIEERDASELAALRESVPVDVRRRSTRAQQGDLGAAHGLADVALAALLVRAGHARSVLVTAGGYAGDLGAAVVST